MGAAPVWDCTEGLLRSRMPRAAVARTRRQVGTAAVALRPSREAAVLSWAGPTRAGQVGAYARWSPPRCASLPPGRAH